MKKIKEEVIEEIIEDPLDDSEIRHYLPEAKILKYSELVKYRDINELLSKPIDYAIILYQDSESSGHWICLLKYEDVIEYFDSYGFKPDSPLYWTPCLTRRKIGVVIPYITRLFNRVSHPQYVIYNPICYQEEKDNINTCGRHCIYRIQKLINDNLDLSEYYKLMVFLKKKYKMNADEIVSSVITIT